MSAREYLSEYQFPPANYRSAYRRAQEISAHLPVVAGSGKTSYSSEKRAAIRQFSRSTISGEHLKGLSMILPGSASSGPNSAMYDSDTKVIHTGFPLSGSYSGNRGRNHQAEIQHALLHETGHHNTSRLQSFGGYGVSEALAENFAEKHRTPKLKYNKSSYDLDVKGDKSPEAKDYRKTRKSGELPSGFGKVL